MNINLDDVVDVAGEADQRKVMLRLFAVYDEKSGDVVQVHSCRGDAQFVAEDRHPQMALEMAAGFYTAGDLRVMPVPDDLLPQITQGPVALHVDVKSGKIKVTKTELPS